MTVKNDPDVPLYAEPVPFCHVTVTRVSEPIPSQYNGEKAYSTGPCLRARPCPEHPAADAERLLEAIVAVWPHLTGHCWEGDTPACFATMRYTLSAVVPGLPYAADNYAEPTVKESSTVERHDSPPRVEECASGCGCTPEYACHEGSCVMVERPATVEEIAQEIADSLVGPVENMDDCASDYEVTLTILRKHWPTHAPKLAKGETDEHR